MIYMGCDYQEGAFPQILARYGETNLVQQPGYGEDVWTKRARDLIRAACRAPEAEVHLLVGGTQTNSIVLHGMMRSWEGAICCDTGHINGHEAGAVESKGHKVLVVPGKDGKLSAETVEAYMKDFKADDSWMHCPQPAVVYLSQSTERGTLYTLAELEAIRAVCDRWNLKLFCDGARLAYALEGVGNDVTLADLARLCDVFYIGGTKCGSLLGEAVVAKQGALPCFFTQQKQQGAVTAKGRVVGIPFEVFFENDGALYREAGRTGVRTAQKLQDAFIAKGFRIDAKSPTNQVFVTLPKDVAERVAEKVIYSTWKVNDDGSRFCRFCTCWATTDEQIDAIIALL